MRVGRLALPAALWAFALGCSSPPPASLSVEVLRGFSPGEIVPADMTAPAVVLLDSTISMAEATETGAPYRVAAKRAATRFIQGVSARRPIWLYAIGSGSEAECQPLFRGARAQGQAERAALVAEVVGLRARGEGGLAASLDGVRAELEEAGRVAGSRVVVFSDLGRECGGDVCAAASRLAEAGARLDVVVIGDAPAPACLLEPGGLAEEIEPPRADDRPLKFCLETSDPEPMVVACSEVGGLPIAAPTGLGTVQVELDPPLRVEAYFAPGRRQVLQVLEFPLLNPPRRDWRWMERPPVSAGDR